MINKILERYLHTGQTVEISDAVLSKDAGCLYLTGTSNFTPDSAWEESIRHEILAAVPGLKDVRLEMTVVLPALGIDDVLPAAMRLVQENQQDPWMRAVTPDGHVFEEQTLYLSVMGDYAAEQLDRSAADYFTRTLSQELGRPVTVHFRQNEEAQEEVFADIKENWEAPPEPEQPEEEKKRSFADGRIKGRFIEKPPIPMNQLPRDEVPVTVAGKIFSVETRRVKKSERAMKFSKDKDDTSTLATIFMSDKTESVCVKMFCDNKEWAEIEGVMSPGCDIIVSGKQEQDQFLKSMVIRARDIGTWKMPEREDTCEEKRIEAAKRLQQLYPSVFGNLTTEAILTGQAAQQYRDLTSAIIASARARAAAAKIEENEKELLELEGTLETQREDEQRKTAHADKVKQEADKKKQEAREKAQGYALGDTRESNSAQRERERVYNRENSKADEARAAADAATAARRQTERKIAAINKANETLAKKYEISAKDLENQSVDFKPYTPTVVARVAEAAVAGQPPQSTSSRLKRSGERSRRP